MKKILSIIAAGCLSLSLAGCLDMEPTSSITDANYWKDADQVQAFNTGLASLFASDGYTFVEWGEFRSNIYSGVPFDGTNPSYQRFYENTLSQANPGIYDYGGIYTLINQINLMVDKVNSVDFLADAVKSKYLGEAYGMRAYLYFHLLRSYGGVIVNTVHTEGANIDLNNVSRTQNTAEEVMAQIKSDIQASEDAFNGNYSFTDGRTYWSLPATEMLKGEVYLWSGKQMGGGATDYQTALQAYQNVQNNADVALLDNFTDVFAYNNKENKEIILAIHNAENEHSLWNGYYGDFNMQKQQKSAYKVKNAAGSLIDFTSSEYVDLANGDGVLRQSVNGQLFSKLFRNSHDTRLAGSLADVYRSAGTYVGCLAHKFRGTLLAGGSNASWLDDQPIYRYAECILGIAQAKALLGQDPKDEINMIRRRAYGAEYFDSHTAVQYPNENSTNFFNNNPFCKPDSEGAEEAILKEKFREFLFEGKRWYDLRLYDKCVGDYSTANASRLLWPIDENTLGENSGLKQTPGYEIQ